MIETAEETGAFGAGDVQPSPSTSALPDSESALARARNSPGSMHQSLGLRRPIYRFYHHSFKVYGLQDQTTKMVQALQALAPKIRLNTQFLWVVEAGTGKVFKNSDNRRWDSVTRPILEAFFHA